MIKTKISSIEKIENSELILYKTKSNHQFVAHCGIDDFEIEQEVIAFLEGDRFDKNIKNRIFKINSQEIKSEGILTNVEILKDWKKVNLYHVNISKTTDIFQWDQLENSENEADIVLFCKNIKRTIKKTVKLIIDHSYCDSCDSEHSNYTIDFLCDCGFNHHYFEKDYD